MKSFLIAFSFLAAVCFSACNNQQNEPLAAAKKDTTASLEGNWITVSMEQNGKVSTPKRTPQEFKMFHDGYFSLVMYDNEGKFYLGAAGPYELNGNMYKETLAFCNDTTAINDKNWQKWELKGDTLIFYGFEKAELADGKDVTNEWNAGGKFIEKRVRVKK